MHLKSFGAHATRLRLERMKASPRYVDGAFANTTPVAQGLKTGRATPTIAEFLTPKLSVGCIVTECRPRAIRTPRNSVHSTEQ
jgi:hypothetical protein